MPERNGSMDQVIHIGTATRIGRLRYFLLNGLLRMLTTVPGTHSPFAAPRRFCLLSEGLLPCERRVRQANS
jgi:hypothetical protein